MRGLSIHMHDHAKAPLFVLICGSWNDWSVGCLMGAGIDINQIFTRNLEVQGFHSEKKTVNEF